MGLLYEKQVTAPSIEKEMPEIKEAVSSKVISATVAEINDWDELSEVFDGEKEIDGTDDKLDAEDFDDEVI
jgi:hypothetical protein